MVVSLLLSNKMATQEIIEENIWQTLQNLTDAKEIIMWKSGEYWYLWWDSISPSPPGEGRGFPPFTGGKVGLFSYDYGLKQLGITPQKKQIGTDTPLQWWREVKNFVVQKNVGAVPCACPLNKGDHKGSPLQWNKPDKKLWQTGFNKTKEYLRTGECYQLNLTTLLQGEFNGDAKQLFAELCAKYQPTSPVLIITPEWQLVSISPEIFVTIKDDKIITKPIKGTAQSPEELLQSEKEAAELNMITDLLRNDLRHICQTGSVQVTAERALMQTPYLWHTYSEIVGKLKSVPIKAKDFLPLLPGGSISGCPKYRACQLIDELEPHRRGLFCGSFGWLADNGQAEFNILIRSLVLQDKKAYLQLGGGITIDSDCESEWQEVLQKGKPFF